MLTEDAVINLLCEHLTADGWKIVSKAMPNQRGTDVVATRAGVRLEAKGAGSSKAHTARFGQPLNQAQARVHVVRPYSRLSRSWLRARRGQPSLSLTAVGTARLLILYSPR